MVIRMMRGQSGGNVMAHEWTFWDTVVAVASVIYDLLYEAICSTKVRMYMMILVLFGGRGLFFDLLLQLWRLIFCS